MYCFGQIPSTYLVHKIKITVIPEREHVALVCTKQGRQQNGLKQNKPWYKAQHNACFTMISTTDIVRTQAK
jgi:hypothetical protein